MGYSSAIILSLWLGATVGAPAYTYTGAAPTGACVGSRVWIDALGTGTYYCNGGTWAAVTAGGGAPTTAQYWTGAADGTLSAEKNLGALGTGVVINTGGVPSILTAQACVLPNVATGYSASGTITCGQPSNVTGNAATATTSANLTGQVAPTLGAACSPNGKTLVDTNSKFWACIGGVWEDSYTRVGQTGGFDRTPTPCLVGRAAQGVASNGDSVGCFEPVANPAAPYWEALGADSTAVVTRQPSGQLYTTATAWGTTDSLSVPNQFYLDFNPTAHTTTTGIVTAGTWRFRNEIGRAHV